jgi:hypothetical protein
MTRLISIGNGGTPTGFCSIDGDEVRCTKTLTTCYGLSRADLVLVPSRPSLTRSRDEAGPDLWRDRSCLARYDLPPYRHVLEVFNDRSQTALT